MDFVLCIKQTLLVTLHGAALSFLPFFSFLSELLLQSLKYVLTSAHFNTLWKASMYTQKLSHTHIWTARFCVSTYLHFIDKDVKRGGAYPYL